MNFPIVQGVEPPTLYEYIGSKLVAFTAFFIPCQIIFVALRFYSRSLVKTKDPADNILCLLSLMLQLVQAGFALGAVSNAGVGHHVEVLTPQTEMTFGKYLVAVSVLYAVVMNIPKLAILNLYRGLFPQKKVKIVIYAIGIAMLFQSIIAMVLLLAACEPFAANWNPLLLEPPTNGHCIDKEALFKWNSIPNIATDLAMLILPIPIIVNLNMNTRVKIGVAANLLVGSFGLITSCLRLVKFCQDNAFIDPTFAAVDLIIWTQLEVGVYLISACLMAFKPLLERVIQLPSRNLSDRVASRSQDQRGNACREDRSHNYGSRLGFKSNGANGRDVYLLRGQPVGFERLHNSGDTLISGAKSHRVESFGSQRGIVVTTEIDMTSRSTRLAIKESSKLSV